MNDLIGAFEASVVGRSCRVTRREVDWTFDLGNGTIIAVGCHWRLISTQGIALTDEDDGHQFGLLKPVDAEAQANELLAGATVSIVAVDRLTSDLSLRFSNELRLDLLNNSSGYEGWQCSFAHGESRSSIVASSGGGLAFF
ncbi:MULTISPECIES: hypothetical protein [Caulobacter]|jgi:hypothetical protein|uniref:Uncharacterized protein n=1 Tax=Caulobacter vibrioides OR37 TaxID=1292034 RepID=R0EGS7_CAUVI|nr:MULTISPECIES: hypothetical protein [Caulobacter]ENZ81204.1 hypothetical protein OR37_02913 [Caulobacter vibrioides OR37]MBQ1562537.1 hypothetical protein [Caulobacter sp.]